MCAGTGIWAGAYEPLIPGTILDTRKYAGKFSQRVRFNDIDHVLMKKYMPGTTTPRPSLLPVLCFFFFFLRHRGHAPDLTPLATCTMGVLYCSCARTEIFQYFLWSTGRSVSVTKGRISIVWEGVNTFSDHYGKRLTLKLNVAQLVAKRNKQADRKRKGSSFHKEKDDEKHSTKHERRPEEDDGADDDDNDG